jgi:hypothetical protein
MRRMTRRAAWAAAWMALAACPGRLDDPDRFRACQLDVESQIFVPKCGTAGCHDAVSKMNGLDLVTPGVANRLRTGTSTCMGKSLLVHIPEKLTLNPPCGSPMPLGAPLMANEVACIKQYLIKIADGGTRDGGADGG